jgi:signal-transduction protein with cAMP-binding, CBS, and nucleotidyltransferase domain
MIYGTPTCRPHEGKKDMAQLVRDVVTPSPVALPATATWVEAALAMRDFAVGDVLGLDTGRICGIVMERDLTVRGIANGDHPETVKLAEIGSRELTTLSPTDRVEDAVRDTREKVISRLPAVENGQPNGIVSLGDLAIAREPHSALSDLSAAPPNRLSRWFPRVPGTPSGRQGDMKCVH